MKDLDRFGNRWRQNGANQSTLTFTGNNPGTPANNNRIDGYSYDTPGNMLYDGVHHYSYDAENRLISVDSGATATYAYDASGRRVYRTGYTSDTCDSTGKRDYTYDLAGRAISEYNVNGTNCKIEVYAGGRLLATQLGGTSFVHSDWLGTVRLRNSFTYPTLYTTCTSLPFGDALNCTNYTNTLHFTGKERDSESNLDNFGARYNASSFGRFMSSDRPGDQKREDPQSMNLYTYVRNRPLTDTDPSGRFDCDKTKSVCQSAIAANALIRAASFDINNPNIFALQKVSDTLGTYGDGNGVTVTSADFSGTQYQNADAKTDGKSIIFNSKSPESTDQMAATLVHEGTHVLQHERADSMHYSSLGLVGLWNTDSRPSWKGQLAIEKEAYTNQGYMEQALHLKGQIYDPTDTGPGADARRYSRINSGARGSANIVCGSGSVGTPGAVCQE